ncbi:transposase, IS4 family protein [Burkholderia lata]|uniref:Transposase, IS4 family protein n=1 Tax=Burkholderia lata (strain ATCC 17760 / DSM 23089 / LMG 22485 / NCIMB 9086 / R18194 / 383) TaxID=482957 RepID=A0A6P3BVT4_BURL3|nr:transposase, IS4 family protein [Burkholderia lata]
MPLYRNDWTARLPDEGTILRFRHLLEKHRLDTRIFVRVTDILRVWGRGEHLFRAIKWQFDCTGVCHQAVIKQAVSLIATRPH